MSAPEPLQSNVEQRPSLADQYRSIDNLLRRPSPFGNETGELANGVFAPGVETVEKLHRARVLVLGAGGLGCELLKDLGLMGFRDVHVIDLDTIDVTNLNRQFLFRAKDIGRSKAAVASEFVARRVPGMSVTAYNRKIQDFDNSYFRQFDVIIGGLDNLDARRWMNATLCSFVEVDENGDAVSPDGLIPFLDGGTEGADEIDVSAPDIGFEEQFQECTIAETPRQPSHCVAYAMDTIWQRERPGEKLDKDNPEHMRWVYEHALERAEAFGISGVTYQLTMGVVKNIIPAVASSNALVSAVCALEAFKIVTFASQTLNNYFMFMGTTGVNSETFSIARKDAGECLACRQASKDWTVDPAMTLQELLDKLKEDPALQLKDPSVGSEGKNLFIARPASLRRMFEKNLSKPLRELMSDGENTFVTDQAFPEGIALNLTINFEPSA